MPFYAHHPTTTSNPLKRPRQEPVSCQFCRTKKLRCNRQAPCSNCAARGLPCDGRPAPYVRKSSEPIAAESEVASADLSILARLKRLEEMVMGRDPEAKVNGTDSGIDIESEGFPGPKAAVVHDSTAIVAAQAFDPEVIRAHPLNGPGSHPTTTSSPSLVCLSTTSEYHEAVLNLEEAGASQAPWPALKGLDIRIMPIHKISVDLFHYASSAKRLCLPPIAEARLLFNHYFSYLDPLQHVLHVPTVQAMMESTYVRLESGLPVVPSDVALMLAIFASASALCIYFPGDTRPFIPSSDAVQASTFWTETALEVLEFTRRTSARQLADIQAGIILGFLLFHGEGFSTRARCLLISGVAMARDMCLHKIDAPTGHPADSPGHRESIDTEIKRRVWWHIVATDWLLSLGGSPQDGTYFVQPRHMRVNMPRNVDDEDLLEDHLVDKPLSEPTIMSYYIQRIKLSEISRHISDTMPLTNFEIHTVDYQDVINLDREFETFFQDMPDFFKIEKQHILDSEPTMNQHPPMQIQRYALNMIALTRRCKLHQPFLIRHSVHRHYDYSRKVSLESARTVVRMKELLQIDERGDFIAVSGRHTGVVYHIFMATIVLVMDLCFNKAGDGEDDSVRKAEVIAACKVLEEAKSQSGMAADFLESLLDVLRKHKVRLHNNNSSSGLDAERTAVGDCAYYPPGLFNDPRNPAQSDLAGNRPSSGPEPQQQAVYGAGMPMQDISQHYLSDFDAIWQEYVELGPNMDVPGWDSIFSDLETRL